MLESSVIIKDSYERLNLEALNIFGSDRLGMMKLDTTIYAKRIKAHTQDGDIEVDSVLYVDSAVAYQNKYQRPLGKKRFELKDHLGNVQAVITDKKTAIPDTTSEICNTDYYRANTLNSYSYYPFGMQMPGRTYTADTSGSYRYGFNGMEKDDEVKGSGNSYTTFFRQYEPRVGRWLSLDSASPGKSRYPDRPRVGRWLSLDPKASSFPWQSPFTGFNNNPTWHIDPQGDSSVYYDNEGNILHVSQDQLKNAAVTLNEDETKIFKDVMAQVTEKYREDALQSDKVNKSFRKHLGKKYMLDDFRSFYDANDNDLDKNGNPVEHSTWLYDDNGNISTGPENFRGWRHGTTWGAPSKDGSVAKLHTHPEAYSQSVKWPGPSTQDKIAHKFNDPGYYNVVVTSKEIFLYNNSEAKTTGGVSIEIRIPRNVFKK